jgi:hypothetical protein
MPAPPSHLIRYRRARLVALANLTPLMIQNEFG